MLKSLLDSAMDRRSRWLLEQVRDWLPADGPVLDLGSGTGHLAARIERELRLDVIPADVSDLHVTGRPPVLVADGPLPFGTETCTATLLLFMLAYPADPPHVLAEAARVTRRGGPVIIVQSLSAGWFGRSWHRAREFLWTVVAFHASKLVGYVPRGSAFSMRTRRFYSDGALRRDVAAAGLRIRALRERPVLPGRGLVVAAWMLERDE
jgi:ubiquinone/menaquinone biosynthesis C-methylase UbiE